MSFELSGRVFEQPSSGSLPSVRRSSASDVSGNVRVDTLPVIGRSVRQRG